MAPRRRGEFTCFCFNLPAATLSGDLWRRLPIEQNHFSSSLVFLFFLFFSPADLRIGGCCWWGGGGGGAGGRRGGNAITDCNPPNFTQSYVGKANSSEPLPLKGPLRIDGPADGVKWGRSHMQRLPPISASFTQRPQTRPFPPPSLSGEVRLRSGRDRLSARRKQPFRCGIQAPSVALTLTFQC